MKNDRTADPHNADVPKESSAHPPSPRIRRLEELARRIRTDIITLTYEAGESRKGHPGGALSAADIVTALYFDIMRIRPREPDWPDRDRFILSKGHACPVLYAALANRGYFDKKQYRSFRRLDGMLQGHPDMKSTPGVDMTTGSLGHGLSAGMGMALSSRIDEKGFRVFVLLGDGECQEGLVWEAALSAPRYGLHNLVAIIDRNRLQSSDWVVNTIPMEPLDAKWRAFGWNVTEIDGHDMHEIIAALDSATRCDGGRTAGAPTAGAPTVIIANTVKGKGVSFMEDNNDWHQKAPNRDQFEQALAEIAGGTV